MDDFEITGLEPGDGPALTDICIRTGDAGDDPSDRYANPELLPLVYCDAYVQFEPDLVFVLRDRTHAPVGYLIGAADSRAFEARLEQDWWPELRQRYPLGSTPDGMLGEALVRKIHDPDLAPEQVVDQYPAHLHIDLLPQGRGGGNGRRLMQRFLDALRDRDVPGVHLGVGAQNTNAIGYYEHLGFETLIEYRWGRIMGLSLV